MSCIHYKFKSSKDYDTLTFDGLHISLSDLKKAIMQHKKLSKTGSIDFDLQIVNAQTREVYKEADELIPKNTSVVVARIPVGRTGKPWEQNQVKKDGLSQGSSQQAKGIEVPIPLEVLRKTADLANANASEDDKIKAMMMQSTKDYDAVNYVKPKYPIGAPRSGYICFYCNKPGHFIQNCPNKKETGDGPPPKTKRSTGIPASFLTPVSDPTLPGAVLTHTGNYAVPILDAAAYAEGKKEKPPFVEDKTSHEPNESDDRTIPGELLCLICKDLLTDAVVIPCCGNSFCDECIRNELLATENHVCPKCGESDQSPDQLIANKFLRTAVNSYLNETGYFKPKSKRVANTTPGATPDISMGSPAVNASPVAEQTPPQDHAQHSHHNLPPELIGLPPQVIKARMASLRAGKSSSSQVSASSSPAQGSTSPAVSAAPAPSSASNAQATPPQTGTPPHKPAVVATASEAPLVKTATTVTAHAVAEVPISVSAAPIVIVPAVSAPTSIQAPYQHPPPHVSQPAYRLPQGTSYSAPPPQNVPLSSYYGPPPLVNSTASFVPAPRQAFPGPYDGIPSRGPPPDFSHPPPMMGPMAGPPAPHIPSGPPMNLPPQFQGPPPGPMPPHHMGPDARPSEPPGPPCPMGVPRGPPGMLDKGPLIPPPFTNAPPHHHGLPPPPGTGPPVPSGPPPNLRGGRDSRPHPRHRHPGPRLPPPVRPLSEEEFYREKLRLKQQEMSRSIRPLDPLEEFQMELERRNQKPKPKSRSRSGSRPRSRSRSFSSSFSSSRSGSRSRSRTPRKRSWSRPRSRSPKRFRSKSRSLSRGRRMSRSRSRGWSQPRSRSRSPRLMKRRSWSRSPKPKGSRSRTRSPFIRRGSRSPARRSRSPGRRSPARRSPFRRSRSLRRSKSPMLRSKSPLRRSKSPPRRSLSPRRSRTPLRSRSRTPLRMRRSRSPVKRSVTPDKRTPPPPGVQPRTPVKQSSAPHTVLDRKPGTPVRDSRSPAPRSPVPVCSKSPPKNLSKSPPPAKGPASPIAPKKRSPLSETIKGPLQVTHSPAPARRRTPPPKSPPPGRDRTPPHRSPPRKQRARSPKFPIRGPMPESKRRGREWSPSKYYGRYGSPPPMPANEYDYGADRYRYTYNMPQAEPPRHDDYRYQQEYHDTRWAEYFNYYREWYDRMMKDQAYPSMPGTSHDPDPRSWGRSRSPPYSTSGRRSPRRSPPRSQRDPYSDKDKKEFYAFVKEMQERDRERKEHGSEHDVRHFDRDKDYREKEKERYARERQYRYERERKGEKHWSSRDIEKEKYRDRRDEKEREDFKDDKKEGKRNKESKKEDKVYRKEKESKKEGKKDKDGKKEKESKKEKRKKKDKKHKEKDESSKKADKKRKNSKIECDDEKSVVPSLEQETGLNSQKPRTEEDNLENGSLRRINERERHDVKKDNPESNENETFSNGDVKSKNICEIQRYNEAVTKIKRQSEEKEIIGEISREQSKRDSTPDLQDEPIRETESIMRAESNKPLSNPPSRHSSTSRPPSRQSNRSRSPSQTSSRHPTPELPKIEMENKRELEGEKKSRDEKKRKDVPEGEKRSLKRPKISPIIEPSPPGTEEPLSPLKKTNKEDALLVKPPELSKWETNEPSSSEEEVVPTVTKRRRIDPPKNTTSLPKSVIETAEKVLANKPRKGAIVASSVTLSPPKISSAPRKVYMERSLSPSRYSSKSNRKVTGQVASMQVTVSTGKDRSIKPEKTDNTKPFDLRDKLKGGTSSSSTSKRSEGDRRNVVRTSSYDEKRKAIQDRKISVIDEDIFEPDYDEGVESDHENLPAKPSGATAKPRTAMSSVSKPEFSSDEDSDSDSGSDDESSKPKSRDKKTGSKSSVDKKSKSKHKHKEKDKDKDKHHKKKSKKEKKKHKKHKSKDKYKD